MTAPEFLRARRGAPHVSAHRGASAKAPENTLAALDRAWRDGATLAEIDVRLTRDGHVVLMHDRSVERTTDGRGPVEAMTREEVRALDAGGWFGPAFRGERVPELRDVIRWARGKLVLLVELKNYPCRDLPLAERTVELIEATGSSGYVVPAGFDHVLLREIKRAHPHWAVEMIYNARLPDPAAAVRAAGASLVSAEPEFVLPQDIALLHGAGAAVLTTLARPEDAPRLLAWGVDVFESDDPAMVVAALREAGRA
jgi:glycerophosphoryl diester phosphodiesterase